jgi:hypothetical protein
MVSNFSQYSPQGLTSQFPGLQGAGWPQLSPGLFGQPGVGGGNVSFGQDPGQAGLSQQYPFGAQANSSAQNPFTQNQLLQSPFVTQPYQQSQLLQGSLAHNPFLNSFASHSGGHHPAQHLITVLGQLVQQLAVHDAMTQQLGIALHQLAQQLTVQSLQGYPGGFGAGQAFAGAGQPFGLGGPLAGGPGGQYFGQNPFAGAIQAGYGQGGYSGFNPQAQAWGGNRPQTIQ